ncbi:hypothetical protein GOODEAATRI_012121, partial [Goodea atripinnis]
LMDHLPQKQLSTDPCGPNMLPGPCAVIRASPALPSQPPVPGPHLFTPPDVLKNQSGLGPTQVPTKGKARMQSVEDRPTPQQLASISRPRPTALGTKTASKTSKIPLESSKDIDLIPVCIPGPQSANVLPHSSSEPSFPLNYPQSPQPYLKPTLSPNLTPSLSPKPSLNPQPQKTPLPGTSTKSPTQSERPGGENNDFR